MKIKIFTFIMLFQLMLIIFLGEQIYNRVTKNKVSISYIDKNSINKRKTPSLKYFYELKPGITKIDKPNWLDKEATYTFNKDGLNERFNYQTEKPENVFRIITLGDSFTFGEYVNTKDNWTELLEDKLVNLNCNKFNKYEVINLGVYGYDVEYVINRYKTHGQKYNPDLLLWMFVEDKRINELTTPFYYNCKNISPTTSIDNEIDHICAKAARDDLVEKFGIDYIHSLISQQFNRIFDFFDKKIIAIDLKDKHQQILKKASKPKQIDIISYDLNGKLRFLDGHPNQAGHQKIAEDVFNYLMKNKIIPCD